MICFGMKDDSDHVLGTTGEGAFGRRTCHAVFPHGFLCRGMAEGCRGALQSYASTIDQDLALLRGQFSSDGNDGNGGEASAVGEVAPGLQAAAAVAGSREQAAVRSPAKSYRMPFFMVQATFHYALDLEKLKLRQGRGRPRPHPS